MRGPDQIKRLLRPAYRKIRSDVLARVEPYVYVEGHAERLFWKYLAVRPTSIHSLVIVGAWQGAEIPDLLGQYRQAKVIAFEPSPTNFRVLEHALATDPRVQCFELAISDTIGQAEFHEGSLPGSGSLLPFGSDDESPSHNVGLLETEAFTVGVSTLDDHDATRDLERIDLLKIDVQGAEERVLRGGRRLLGRTSAVLIEVALRGSAYAEATTFDAINGQLTGAGFTLCGLGVDPITLDGNALYLRITK